MYWKESVGEIVLEWVYWGEFVERSVLEGVCWREYIGLCVGRCMLECIVGKVLKGIHLSKCVGGNVLGGVC